MEYESPASIALEIRKILESIQSSDNIHYPIQHFDYSFNISGVPTIVTLSLLVGTPNLIEIQTEVNKPNKNNVLQLKDYKRD